MNLFLTFWAVLGCPSLLSLHFEFSMNMREVTEREKEKKKKKKETREGIGMEGLWMT